MSNGDFSSGLTDWETIGPVFDGGGYARLEEDLVFSPTTLQRRFVIPDLPLTLSFDCALSYSADTTSGSPLPDAFTASLLNAATLDPILHTPGWPDYFYHDTTGAIDFDSTIVTHVGDTVTLDIRSASPGTEVLLAFDLLGNDNGLATEVTIDNVDVTVVPAPGALVLGGIGLGLVGWLKRRPRHI